MTDDNRTGDPGPYAHLSDPAERKWLTNVSPLDVVRNAHRMYAFIAEAGLPADSYTRELAFEKAADKLGISYNALDDAWLNERPIRGEGTDDDEDDHL